MVGDRAAFYISRLTALSLGLSADQLIISIAYEAAKQQDKDNISNWLDRGTVDHVVMKTASSIGSLQLHSTLQDHSRIWGLAELHSPRILYFP